jgi:putative ABC transport system permease protein
MGVRTVKFLPFVVKNVLRNKVRSLFTSLSIAISLFLIVLLYSFLSVQEDVITASAVYNRLVVTHVQGLTAILPVAYLDRIREIPEVLCAAPLSWYGGRYRDEKMPFAQFGTDADSILDVLPEYHIPEDQLAAWREDRTGCVVGSIIARNKGWSIGTKIPLKGDIYPVDLELTVRGIYDGAPSTDREMLWFHFSYFDESLRAEGQRTAGNAGIVMLRCESARTMTRVMNQIDEMFANSDAPVRAMTEKAFQQSFMEMVGNVKAFIQNTAMAVIFSLVCVAANSMAMSLRERTREIAVLKAIGFGRSTVMGLFLGESMLIAVLGGALGAFGAKAFFGAVDLSRFGLTGMSWLYIPLRTALAGLLLAAGIGLAAGVIPAWRAASQPVVEGLRKIV